MGEPLNPTRPCLWVQDNSTHPHLCPQFWGLLSQERHNQSSRLINPSFFSWCHSLQGHCSTHTLSHTNVHARAHTHTHTHTPVPTALSPSLCPSTHMYPGPTLTWWCPLSQRAPNSIRPPTPIPISCYPWNSWSQAGSTRAAEVTPSYLVCFGKLSMGSIFFLHSTFTDQLCLNSSS